MHKYMLTIIAITHILNNRKQFFLLFSFFLFFSYCETNLHCSIVE